MSIDSNYECLICMDLLIEPVTTPCGHTFCKLCLVKYLKENQKCPICRKGIFQSIDNISKNILLESLIKEKYKDQYEERIRALSPQLEQLKSTNPNEDDNSDPNSNITHSNIPTIVVNKCYIMPEMTKELTIPVWNNNILLNTVIVSSINDKILVIVPSNHVNEGMTCSMCEILGMRKEMDNVHRKVKNLVLKVKGIRRLKLIRMNEFAADLSENQKILINISNCQNLFDVSNINSEDIKDDMTRKMNDIENFHNSLLKQMPFSLRNKVVKEFGEPPRVPLTFNKKIFENISLFYLFMINDEEKYNLVNKTNIVERINWIHHKFLEDMKYRNNISFGSLFYDVENDLGKGKDLKYILFFLGIFIIFGILAKFNIVNIN